jgi:hypothetical protein
MTALFFGRIVMGEGLSVDPGRVDMGGTDSADGDAEEGNEEEVDMDIDEV